jgi:hypothetical protein
MKAIMTATLLALAVTTAGAEEGMNSVNDMLPYCKLTYEQATKRGTFTTAQWGRCMGLIEGASILLTMRKDGIVETTIDALCAEIPPGVKKEQAMRVVVRYADQHPNQIRRSLLLLAVDALHEAWPCSSTEFDKRFRGGK